MRKYFGFLASLLFAVSAHAEFVTGGASGGGGGSGTVTTASVVTANGFAGTVANPTTTPAFTLSTTINGMVKGNGTALSAAAAGTDYVAPGGALGTPASGVATNLTGTAAGLTAGNVSTINGLLSAGSNIAITGAGTSGSPYSIASSGGSATAAAFQQSIGDSITCGVGAGNNPACNNGGFAYLLSPMSGALLSPPGGVNGTPGYFACDSAYYYVFPNQNPALASSIYYTLMLGTNEANTEGAGAYEPIYEGCHRAILSWLGLPLEYKTPASSATLTGTWANDSTTWGSFGGETSTTNGSTQSYSITTTGNPVYIWYRQHDGDGGTFTYQLDSGSAVTVTTATTPAIATLDGGTNGVGLIRLTGVAAGTHTVAIAVTSSTSASNNVSIAGVGTAPSLSYWNAPTVLSTGVIEQQSNANAAATLAYNNDALADNALIASDGLAIKSVNVRPYVNSTTDMYNGLHPNTAGHTHIAQAIADVAQFSKSGAGQFISGFLGIGTATPNFRLDINDGTTTSPNMRITSSSGTATGFVLNNTSPSGHAIEFDATGNGCFAFYDETAASGVFSTCASTGAVNTVSGGVFGFSSSSNAPWTAAAQAGVSSDGADILDMGNGTQGDKSAIVKLAAVISAGTRFTASGCSNSATTGGATVGTYTSGTTGTCTVVVTMNGATGVTAPHGWACNAQDITTVADTMHQSAFTATTATITGTTVSGDVIIFNCTGY